MQQEENSNFNVRNPIYSSPSPPPQKFPLNNKKYSSILNEQQAQLLEHCLDGNDDLIVEQMQKIKRRARSVLTAFYSQCNNKILNEKRDIIINKVEELQPALTEVSISKALVLAELISELESEDE